MPEKKDLKRLVRSRMARTGESYTTALARIRARRPARRTSASETPAPAPTDLAERAGMSDASVSKATGRDWKGWVAVLDRAGAAALPHREITRWLAAQHDLTSWWTQMVAVGYERIRGRRQKGQKADGGYSVNKSRTYPVPLADLWTAFGRCDAWIGEPLLRMSTATRHRTMRMRWTDGAPVVAAFLDKGPAKSAVALQHDRIATRAEADRLRAWWTERLAALGRVLETGAPARRPVRAKAARKVSRKA